LPDPEPVTDRTVDCGLGIAAVAADVPVKIFDLDDASCAQIFKISAERLTPFTVGCYDLDDPVHGVMQTLSGFAPFILRGKLPLALLCTVARRCLGARPFILGTHPFFGARRGLCFPS
jgi:hypothetical protein